MSFQSNANRRPRRNFSWKHMLLFIVLLLVFFMVLFPKNLFIQSLFQDEKPSELSIAYLNNMIKKYPDDLRLRVNLAEQEIKLGNIKSAQEAIKNHVNLNPKNKNEWNMLWVYFQITKIIAFELKKEDPIRKEKEAQLKKLLPELIQSPYLTDKDKMQLAESALAFDEPTYANDLYKSIVKKNEKQSLDFYEKVAQTSMYVGDYDTSAAMYLMVMQHTENINEKRNCFIKAVKSQDAKGQAKIALEFASQHIDGLNNDKETLAYLAQLALSANQQKDAERYVNQMMELQYRDIEE